MSNNHDVLAEKDQSNKEAVVPFIMRVATLLPAYGLTVYELESLLYQLSRYFALQAQFAVIAGAIFVAIGALKEQQVIFYRLTNGMPNIEKLRLVRKVIIDVTKGNMEMTAARERLDEIVVLPPLYGNFATIFFGWTIAAGGVAVVFGTGIKEIVVSMAISTVAGLINMYLEKRAVELQRLLEPICALVASVMAVGAVGIIGAFSVPMSIICGLIILMPGYTLTRALTEIALGHTLSGLASFARGILTLLFLVMGVVLGIKLTEIFVPFSNNAMVSGEASHVLILMATVVVMLCLCITFSVSKQQLLWVIIIGSITTIIAVYGQAALGVAIGTGAASFFLGVAANAYSRITGQSDVILKVPCVMVLVPGSVGFKSILSLLVTGPIAGMEIAISMFTIALSIAVSMIFSDILLPPRNFLKTEEM